MLSSIPYAWERLRGTNPSYLPELSRYIYAVSLSLEDRAELNNAPDNDLLGEIELNKLLQERLQRGGRKMVKDN